MARAIYLAYFWLFFMPALVLVTCALGTLCLLVSPFMGPRAAGKLTAVPWARFGLMFSGVNVQVHGQENIDPNQSYVVVANHVSQYDIFALYGWLGIDFRWVAKKEVRGIPVIGIACDKGLGHVFIDRSNHDAALASLQTAKQRIRNGTSIIFFPEGTRSSDGKVANFKKGAFHMARDLNIPLLPVTINGTHEVLPKGSIKATPGNVSITIHPAVAAPSADTPDEVVIARCKTRIESALTDGVTSPSWPDTSI